MNKAELLKMIAITIGMYKQASKYKYIPHFNEDKYCCWCEYSKKHTVAPKQSHNKAHRCVACPILRVNTPNYVEDCTDMFTHRIINPKVQGTWDLRLIFWTMAQRRILEKDDLVWFNDIKNIRMLLWDIDEMLCKEHGVYLTKEKEKSEQKSDNKN